MLGSERERSQPTTHNSEPNAPPASRLPPPALHVITSDLILARSDFLEQARAIMRVLGVRGAVHVRGRHIPTARLHELAAALSLEQDGTKCWLVVNDRVDVALGSGARAVQLTSRSMSVSDARTIAPALGIGASVHSVDEARDATHARADWLIAGHVFDTASHADAPGRGLEFVHEIGAATPLPCIAIGGVRPWHVAELLAAGAYGVAAIRGIWDADDAEYAASEYLTAYDAYRGL